MENWEEQQVWQRVWAEPRGGASGLQPLLREAAELAAVYRHLAGKGHKQAFLELQRGEEKAVRCLRGILALSGEKTAPFRVVPTGKEPMEKEMKRCYHRSRRLMAEYAAAAATPETGLVFQQLAEQERQHCLTLIRLLGERK